MKFTIKNKEVEIRGKHIVLVILFLILAVIIASGFYTVKETEQAVIQTFGRYTSTTGPGLHLKLPWPVQTATILPVQLTQKMEIGYYQDDTGAYHSDEDDSLMITGDMNMVNIDFFIEWKISDPVKYLFASESPELVLRNLLMSTIRSVVGTRTIDEALTTGKFGIQNDVQTLLMEKLEENDIGVQILDVKVNNSEPPTEEVAKAFRDVETSKQEKDMVLNEATAYRNRRIPEAKAKADELTRQAEAKKATRVAEAQGLYDRYQSVYEEYKKFPEITRKRMYLEIIQEALPNTRVVVDESGQLVKFMPLGGPENSLDLSGKTTEGGK